MRKYFKRCSALVAKGQSIVEDINHPNTAEIDEAAAYLSENSVNVPPEIEALCIQYGKENGIAPELLEAICWKESRFQPDVVNASGTQSIALTFWRQ